MLQPTFSLTIGPLESSTQNPRGGPLGFLVERDMDVAADGVWIALQERDEIAVGNPIALRLGYAGENQTVFTGAVAALHPRLDRVQIYGLGSMQGLLALRTAAWYDAHSAGAIARELIDQAGLEAGAIDDGPSLPRYAIDRRRSAYAHLRGLADRLGFEFYARRDGAICFHALGQATGLGGGGVVGAAQAGISRITGVDTGRYQFGQHLLQGQASRRPPRWARVVVGGESPLSSRGDDTTHWLTVRDADYRGEEGTGEPMTLLLDPAARSQAIAERFAAGLRATVGRQAHEVGIRVLGQPSVELGESMTVGGVADGLLNGAGYVRALRHHFDAETGFVTDLRMAPAVS